MDEAIPGQPPAAALRRGRQPSGLDPEPIPARPGDIRRRPPSRRGIGWAIARWKIAATNTSTNRPADRPAIYGPYAQYHPSPATSKFETLCSPIPEVEFQVRLDSGPHRREDALFLEEVSSRCVAASGIELAEYRFSHDENFHVAAILADGSGSATLIFGPAIENWEEKDIAGQVVTLIATITRNAAEPQSGDKT